MSCGSSDPETSAAEPSTAGSTVDADFAARADAVCKPYAAYSSRTILAVEDFNRYVPDPELLPRVAAHLADNAAYQDLASDLEALGDPDSGQDAWAKVLSDLHATAQDVDEEIAAARDAASARFTELAGELAQDTTTLRSDLSAAGLAASSCVSAEMDPLSAARNNHQ